MNEHRVTFHGNVRATYLRFKLGNKFEESDQFTEDEDDDVDDDDDKAPILNSVVVDLSNQHLSCFNIEQIPNLQLIKYLHLQNNDLTILPPDLLLSTPGLQWLDVRNNCLRCLPLFKHHTRIRTILAENNQIESLPEDLHTAVTLSKLQLSGNPIMNQDSKLFNLDLEQIKEIFMENENKSHLALDHRNSFDSGVDLKTNSDEDDTNTEESYSDNKSTMREEDEINDFIENKDLYTGKNLQSETEEFNFDDYLYCYKSFHSPLLDQQFEGFSIEKILKDAKIVGDVKKEQKEKIKISNAVQLLKDKQTLKTWREKYRMLKQNSDAKSALDETYEINQVDPPFDHDPDWTIRNSALPDSVYKPSLTKDIRFNQVVEAIEVLEDQLDGEVNKVVRSTSRPGKLDKRILNRRSARIDRIGQKLENVKMKARSMSANCLK